MGLNICISRGFFLVLCCNFTVYGRKISERRCDGEEKKIGYFVAHYRNENTFITGVLFEKNTLKSVKESCFKADAVRYNAIIPALVILKIKVQKK